MKKMSKNLVLPLSLMVLLLTVICGCKKVNSPTEQIPVLSTTEVSSITDKSAISGGNITDEGGSAIIEYGLCWSTEENPTIVDNITVDTGYVSFECKMIGLEDNTTYYVRAYATNDAGVGYGSQVSFETLEKQYSSFSAIIDGMPYIPTALNVSTVFNIIGIAALRGSNNLIIRIPTDFTIGSHPLSMGGDYTAQYIVNMTQLYTSQTGSGSTEILEYDSTTGKIKGAFNFIGTDINTGLTKNITNGQFVIYYD